MTEYTLWLKNTGTTTYLWTTTSFFALMAYLFCHINCDLYCITPASSNEIPLTVYEIQTFKNNTATLMFSIWTSLVTHIIWPTARPQFVLIMATVFTNTRPQSNTSFLDGFINDVLWETTPLFNETVLQQLHVVNVVDALLQHTPTLVVNGVQVWAVRWPHWRCNEIRSTACETTDPWIP